MQDFRGIKAWHRARWLAVAIHRLTRGFPRGYGRLIAQLTDAAESVVFNIVEGAAARTRREFARFLDISIRSSSEVESQLQSGRDYGVISPADWQRLTDETVEIRRMICGFRGAVLRADAAEKAQARLRKDRKRSHDSHPPRSEPPSPGCRPARRGRKPDADS